MPFRLKRPRGGTGRSLTLTAEVPADGASGQTTKIAYTVNNSGDATWKVGTLVHIERLKEDGTAEELSFDSPFAPPSTKLKPNAKLSADHDPGQVLEPGSYRFSLVLENTASGEAVSLSAEFQID